ncbi:MAG: hypothetical protein OES70_14720, partial [Desulfobacterales bacterium]|nr:hypothetical protein [Desulfobacterales bacterium]
MREHKRVLNEFKWTRPEKKNPVFYVIRDGEELYFVNDSTETLNSVSTCTGGCQTLDDEVMPVSSPDPLYLYKNVKPGEAVKVEHYDPYWDSDYLLQLEVELSSPTHGNKIFRVLGKGGIDDTVLLWDTGEAGKYV